MPTTEETYFSAVIDNNVEDVKACLRLGVEINARSAELSRTALILAVTTALVLSKRTAPTLTVTNGYHEMVTFLINAGADINAVDEYGRSALSYGAENRDPSLALLLLQSGADVDLADGRRGWTPLHTAATSDNVACANGLIDKGADVNAQDRYGLTPLMVAIGGSIADMDGPQVALLLARRGADVNITDYTGLTALSLLKGEIDPEYQDPVLVSLLEQGSAEN